MSFDTKPTVSSEAKPLSQGEQLAKSRKHLLWATVLTIALMFVPYSNYALYPLRLFITFIHESGHALAAVLTGGSVESLSVHTNGEGLTIGRFSGAWTWLFSSAGYLGTS